MKDIKFVAIAGGTGAGKSSVAFTLLDRHPETIALLHLDDYHKPRIEVPLLHGMTNWDSPNAIDFDRLVNDLQQLKADKPVTIFTKNERDNLDFEKTQQRIPITVAPKLLILLEGYLSLWDDRVRTQLTSSIFLDLDHHRRMQRRTKFLNPDYEEKVLRPMHNQFVEPTKRFAGLMVDVSSLSAEKVVQKIEAFLKL